MYEIENIVGYMIIISIKGPTGNRTQAGGFKVRSHNP